MVGQWALVLVLPAAPLALRDLGRSAPDVVDVDDPFAEATPEKPSRQPGRTVIRPGKVVYKCRRGPSRSAIARVLEQAHGRFRHCYERGLSRRGAFSGRVMLGLFIQADGIVTDATAAGDLPDQRVQTCVRDVAAVLRFARRTPGVVEVNYPIHFRLRHEVRR